MSCKFSHPSIHPSFSILFPKCEAFRRLLVENDPRVQLETSSTKASSLLRLGTIASSSIFSFLHLHAIAIQTNVTPCRTALALRPCSSHEEACISVLVVPPASCLPPLNGHANKQPFRAHAMALIGWLAVPNCRYGIWSMADVHGIWSGHSFFVTGSCGPRMSIARQPVYT